MIKIRLLGGAKKAVGRSSLDFDRKQASVSEILTFLQGISQEPRLLQAGNLIIAVNGVDSQALSGPDTMAKEGDTVTIVTVVHGGMEDNRLSLWNVLVAGVYKLDDKDTGKLLDRLRAENPKVMVQAADAAAVYGRDHALGALDIVLEAMARNIMIANRPETEVLLRLACTDQIAEALKRARLREGEAGCFIAFSTDAQALKKFGEQISHEFTLDDSVILQSREKRKALAKTVGISQEVDDDKEFLDLLLERAAILIRKN
ncbi:hypothetical protein NTE_02377 [Candidatus Nitrososphaera evergladensis SR1]|uniref:Uncharacterized protein n=1 Tax=Candidatus Nitrososphaera evergladensis SR1 TaxID=1459636 RepID=A0A075MYT6_9ARCH|nr:KEOPS complex subunit Cgi121 [Candidatus Nitrososphaera evergladensis]AIF84429.1 hypothetical protein NTE_02377 [Candidatus Nitrososphaera evergladensis SR1]